MRVFLTGGTGFIGSHLVSALVERGHQCVVVSRGTRTWNSDVVELNNPPAFRYGEKVLAKRTVRNDGTYAGKEIGGLGEGLAAIVQPGDQQAVDQADDKRRAQPGGEGHQHDPARSWRRRRRVDQARQNDGGDDAGHVGRGDDGKVDAPGEHRDHHGHAQQAQLGELKGHGLEIGPGHELSRAGQPHENKHSCHDDTESV